MLNTPLWQQNSSYSATNDRILISTVFAAAGVLAVGDLKVSQHAAGANMSVDVALGRVVVSGTDISGQHKYICDSDAVSNVVITSAPGAGLSRIDLIVAQVLDADQNGGSINDWVLVAVKGTAATTGTQVAPATPASSFVLAQVLVGPTVTSIVTGNITDQRTYAAPINPLVGNPAGRATASSPSTFATTTVTQVGNLVVDSGSLKGGMTFASNVFTVPVPGIYDVKASIEWPGGSSAFDASGLACILWKNGAAVLSTQDIISESGDSGGSLVVAFTDDIQCAAGDTIGFAGSQQSGGSATNITTNGITHISIHLASR